MPCKKCGEKAKAQSLKVSKTLLTFPYSFKKLYGPTSFARPKTVLATVNVLRSSSRGKQKSNRSK